jgi:hypothetical protein
LLGRGQGRQQTQRDDQQQHTVAAKPMPFVQQERDIRTSVWTPQNVVRSLSPNTEA